MAWVEQRGARYRVRTRMPDGAVGTDSWHPTRAAAEIRCKQVDVEQASTPTSTRRWAASLWPTGWPSGRPGTSPG